MDWRELLADLEATLADLEARGVRYLNIAADPALAERLRAFPGAGDSPATAGAGAGDSPATAREAGGDAPGAGASNAVPGGGASNAAPGAGGRAARMAERLRAGGGPSEPAAPPAPTGPPGASTVPDSSAASTVSDSSAASSSSAPRAPEECETLESLSFQYRACTVCKLGHTRSHVVFGVGHARPRLMFIGEGPGAEEDQQGLPFVGRAGALLTGLIQAAGLTRDDVYITNVVKCRPPGNRNPESDEIAACRPILLRQIDLLDPALIVVLGNVPLKALNPSAAGITRERGKPFPFGKWQVLPTFHPSYLLRNPPAIQACWADFKQAVQLAYAPSGGAAER